MDFESKTTIVNLSNTIAKQFGLDPFHETIPEIEELIKGHKKVAVLLFDGMGTYIQETYKKYMPFIYSHVVKTIQSTFPPTTVAATTAFLTGKYPIESGWMSWTQYLDTHGCNVDVFRNAKSSTGEIIREGKYVLEDTCPLEYIKDLINEKNSVQIAYDMDDIFNCYHGPKNLTLARWKVSKFIKDNDEMLLYYYYEKLDGTIHSFGVHHKNTKTKIKSIERFVKKITKANKDTLFIVIADHGLIDAKYIDIAEHPDLIETLSDEKPVSFESRHPTFWIKKGKKKEFEKLFKSYFGEHFDLYNHKEVIDKHIFGLGNVNPEAEKFIGDYLAISKDEYCYKDSRDVNKHIPVGAHGGGYIEKDINIAIFNN